LGQEICLIGNVNTHRNALHIEMIRTHVQKHWIKDTVGSINFFCKNPEILYTEPR